VRKFISGSFREDCEKVHFTIMQGKIVRKYILPKGEGRYKLDHQVREAHEKVH